MGGSRRAGSVHVEWSSNTAKVVTGLEQVKKESRAAARQMKADINEARGTIMVLGEELGVHLPRHIQKFVAEIPGIAPLMANAFSTVAIVGLGVAAVEAGKRFMEMVEKARGVSEAINAGFDKMHLSMGLANDDLRVTNDRLEEQIAKLSGKHPDTLRAEIDEIALSAAKLYQALQADNEQVEKLLKDNFVGLAGQLMGQAGTGEITRQVKDIEKDLDAAASQKKDHTDAYVAQAAALGASLADKKKEAELTAKAQAASDEDEIQRQRIITSGIKQMKAELKAFKAQDTSHFLPGTLLTPAITIGKDTSAQQAIAGGYLQHLKDLRAGGGEQARNSSDTRRVKTLTASAEAASKAQKAYGEFVAEIVKMNDVLNAVNTSGIEELNKTALDGERDRQAAAKMREDSDDRDAAAKADKQRQAVIEMGASYKAQRDAAGEAYSQIDELSSSRVDLGQQSPAARTKQMLSALDEEHRALEASFAREAALWQEGTAEYQRVLGERSKADAEYYMQLARLQSQAAKEGINGVLLEFEKSSMNWVSDLKDTIQSTVADVNGELVRMMTTQYRRGDWKNATKPIFTGLASKGLEGAEGSLMKALGLGGGKMGTRSNPMYTRSADSLPGMPQIASSLPATFAAANGAASGAAGFLSKLTGVAKFFGPMAGGGELSPGGMYLAGEQGPELLQVGSTSRMNNAGDTRKLLSGSGGDTHVHHHWNIDARGATDPAAVRKQVQAGILQAAPHIAGAAIFKMRDDQARRPNMSR